jgi:small subunit ribosomal protein S20
LANTKTALKQWRVSLKHRDHNRPMRATVRTYVTKARASVAQHAETAAADVVKAISELDKAASKKLIHPNAAARRKSRLMKRLNSAK